MAMVRVFLVYFFGSRAEAEKASAVKK